MTQEMKQMEQKIQHRQTIGTTTQSSVFSSPREERKCIPLSREVKSFKENHTPKNLRQLCKNASSPKGKSKSLSMAAEFQEDEE